MNVTHSKLCNYSGHANPERVVAQLAALAFANSAPS